MENIFNIIDELQEDKLFYEKLLARIAGNGTFIKGEYVDVLAVKILCFSLGFFINNKEPMAKRNNLEELLDKPFRSYFIPLLRSQVATKILVTQTEDITLIYDYIKGIFNTEELLDFVNEYCKEEEWAAYFDSITEISNFASLLNGTPLTDRSNEYGDMAIVAEFIFLLCLKCVEEVVLDMNKESKSVKGNTSQDDYTKKVMALLKQQNRIN